MKIYHHAVDLIVDAPPANSKTPFNIKTAFAQNGVPVSDVKTADNKIKGKKKPGAKAAAQAPPQKIKVTTKINDAEMNPWDVAHQAAKAVKNTTFIEPNIFQEFVTDANIDIPFKKAKKGATAKSIPNDSFDPDWQPHQNLIWHLDDAYSQLKSARDAVSDLDYVVRIGHLDTGYNKTHTALPDAARTNKLQRCFVEGEEVTDAHDRYTEGKLRMPGHGTGTLALLAGTKVRLTTDNGIFNDYLGGAPFAEVVCCRISPTVVLMKTTAFAEALNYLTQLTLSGTPIHVVSMSMGGAPTKAWVDAVNAAYDAGITVVTAAGNNFNGLPTQHVIYPARFGRVMAACGVTADYKPYHTSKLGEMQGCYGPVRHMSKALSAYTPNTPWAVGDASRIMFSGAGTSSATPQIAAAAAIYYRKYGPQLDVLEPWQRVEAIRNALFKSARKQGVSPSPFKNYFGNGLLQANEALSIPVDATLPKTEKDSMPWFPILNTIFKAKPSASPSNKMMMYNTELAQLVFYYPELRKIIDNEEKDFSKVSATKWKAFTEAVIQHPGASIALKQFLMTTHQPSH